MGIEEKEFFIQPKFWLIDRFRQVHRSQPPECPRPTFAASNSPKRHHSLLPHPYIPLVFRGHFGANPQKSLQTHRWERNNHAPISNRKLPFNLNNNCPVGSNTTSDRAKPRVRHLGNEPSPAMLANKLRRHYRRLVRQDSTLRRTELRMRHSRPKSFPAAFAILMDNFSDDFAVDFLFRTPRIFAHCNTFLPVTAMRGHSPSFSTLKRSPTPKGVAKRPIPTTDLSRICGVICLLIR